MNKILFLDIDGPLIPGRLFLSECKDEVIPFEVSKFDSVAVGLINRLCEENEWQIVLHSSWVRIVGGARTYEHCLQQGLRPGFFHKDAWCDENENWRYTRIARWLSNHPEVIEYKILDDTPYQADLNNFPHPEDIEDHLILIDFDDGLMSKHYKMLSKKVE